MYPRGEPLGNSNHYVKNTLIVTDVCTGFNLTSLVAYLLVNQTPFTKFLKWPANYQERVVYQGSFMYPLAMKQNIWTDLKQKWLICKFVCIYKI